MYDDKVCAVVEQLPTVLRITGSIPAWNQYLFDIQVVAIGLDCSVSVFLKYKRPNAPTI